MDNTDLYVDELKRQIITTERELQRLKARLATIEAHKNLSKELELQREAEISKWHLFPEEYRRYGRQLIVPNIGIKGIKIIKFLICKSQPNFITGQLRLRSSSVLIVGVGGLGCPAAVYLAGAGVGKIGLVDGDQVEISNLHRQIIHNTNTIGMYKVDSAISYLSRLVLKFLA